MKRLVLLALLGVPSLAVADVAPAPGTCVDYEPDGCSCNKQTLCAPGGDDMSIPRDLAAPRDLRDVTDAQRERRRAHGRGLVLLSAASALAVIALRRRYKMSSPTPAESALAASETRNDS